MQTMLTTFLRWIAQHLLAEEWAELHSELRRREAIALKSPPSDHLVKLLVSGEDCRHGRHAGFDIRAILRATFRAVVYNKPEGASTIEQQIARVITNRFERTLRRKLREIALASMIANKIDKRCLPAIYLQIGYFGTRMIGLESACSRLGLDPKHLSLRQAALVVARLKYPEPHAPNPHRQRQIAMRASHLLRLHERHSQDQTYEFLGPSTIQDTGSRCKIASDPNPGLH